MRFKDLIGLDPFNLNNDVQEEAYAALISENIDEIPKKHLRKALEISISLLKINGEKIDDLQKEHNDLPSGQSIQVDNGTESANLRLEEENAALKATIIRLNNEKSVQKEKIKELSDENFNLKKRLQNMQSIASDKDDSSDPLSELDRQEELMRNISSKNKHIKRLLVEIEVLEKTSIEQIKRIIELEKHLEFSNSEISKLTGDLANSQSKNVEVQELLAKSNEEINRLEANITFLEDEREKTDTEFKSFVEKLEERAILWKKVLDEKENQLESLRERYEQLLYSQYPAKTSDGSEKLAEIRELVEAMEERDSLIEALESRLKSMADEMIQSTQIMNKISLERETSNLNYSKTKYRSCCKAVEQSLEVANARCKELAEMLSDVEEDNILKARQAIEAVQTLQAYQSGEDGLAQALRKISSLQQKLNSRDKQIKALVIEVNSLNDFVQENAVLRKRLNIPDDEIIIVSNFVAKQKNKDKIIERLNLKLRASEEMRLRLKLEKNELRKQIFDLKSKIENIDTQSQEEEGEIGSIRKNFTEHKAMKEVYCSHCLKSMKAAPHPDDVLNEVIQEWEAKYSSVVEENENLRVGMHEILEKIREYDATSEHITIDCSILERVLHALDARSISGWYHPAMRMQNELIAVKEREYALREKINFVQRTALAEENRDNLLIAPNTQSDTVRSVTSERSDDIILQIVHEKPAEFHDFRADTLYPVVLQKENDFVKLREQFLEHQEKYRKIILELEEQKIYKCKYEEISTVLKETDESVTNYCTVLVEKITEMEMKLMQEQKKYEFMNEDYQRTLNEQQSLEFYTTNIIAELKKEIILCKNEMDNLKMIQKREVISQIGNFEEEMEHKKDLGLVKMNLANFVSRFYDGKLAELYETYTSIVVGVVKDNLEVEYITNDEYISLKVEHEKLLKESENLKIERESLRKLLAVEQEQIISQQRQFLDITDKQISLRHLVADLQTQSDEKYLIAKMAREIEDLKSQLNDVKTDLNSIKGKSTILNEELEEERRKTEKFKTQKDKNIRNNELKMRYLKFAILRLREEFCKYTPLITLTDFISTFSGFVKRKHTKIDDSESDIVKKIEQMIEQKVESSKIKETLPDFVKNIKLESKCEYLERQLVLEREKYATLEAELDESRLKSAENTEHWRTIEMLFGQNIFETDGSDKSDNKSKDSKNYANKETQTDQVEMKTNWSNTEDLLEKTDDGNQISSTASNVPIALPRKSKPAHTPPYSSPIHSGQMSSTISSPKRNNENISIRSLESQLKQAMNLASMRSALLLETENRLVEAQARNKEMERMLESKSQQLKEVKNSKVSGENVKGQQDIIESNISSLHTLLTEKDSTLSHYQLLLNTEREQHQQSCETYEKEISVLKKATHDLETSLNSMEQKANELRSKLNSNSTRQAATANREDEDDELKNFEDNESNFNEISDEKIEEMFMDEQNHSLQDTLSQNAEIEASNRQILQLQMQLREANNREILWERTIRAKEDEVNKLKDRISNAQAKEKPEIVINPEVEELRLMLEEKDKHINDLMETLANFHDDQQRFITETSLYSADQVSQLGTDLTRSETTNRILSTQLEAVKRQLGNLTIREKQARDLVNSLKNQLIKRPVISVKTELTNRSKTEQLQKRNRTLEAEIEEQRQEVKRLMDLVIAKRAKSAADLSLWQKQKHWQQTAEKLKMKLQETETTLERTKATLNTARNTILRLEKDKHILELRQAHKGNGRTCCGTPSCPNLMKYAPSETPDSYTTTNTEAEAGSPHHRHQEHNGDSQKDFINALKARIESQQRKIIAYELEGKGTNALTTELVKLQEKVVALESQSIRMEAKNLQLQLDIDQQRQGDESERLRRRIKHLEDYILALKEELADFQARLEMDTKANVKQTGNQSTQQMEQTILSLKRVVERLNVENKSLKSGRIHTPDFKTSVSPCEELLRIQALYMDSLDRIATLKSEIKLKTNSCPNCCRKPFSDEGKGNAETISELNYVKEKLCQKTQLLEKAKILLTRAAAKEKNLKEQIEILRRKCCELSNVPVIDEISE